MSDQLKNLIIGLFVAAAFVILVFILLFLHPSTGDEGEVLYVRFPDIDKVNVGTRVTFAGKAVGEIAEIVALENARDGYKDKSGHVYPYQLKLLIDSDVKVYDTDQFSLRTSGLLGERSVAIIPYAPQPGQKPKLLTRDDVIYAQETSSVEETMMEFKDVANKVELALDQVSAILDDVRKEELVHKISMTAKNLSEITEALNQPDQLSAIINNVQEFTAELSQRLPPSWDKLDESLDELKVTMANARDISITAKNVVNKIGRGEGTLGRILVKEDLYLELKAILGKVNTLSNDVNHYGLLFHLDKGWQRTRARRANLMQRLSTPQEFRNYFNDEMDQVSNSLSRVSMALDRIHFCEPECALYEDQEFVKVYAELLRRMETMEDSIKMYNEQVMEPQCNSMELD